MTPKDKANSLVVIFYGHTITKDKAINCAIIAVEEILSNELLYSSERFWQSVLTELQNL